MELKVINLSDGHKQIIPNSCTVLNPKMEGKRPYAYFVWPIPTQENLYIDFDASTEGRGFHTPFVYFTNFKDLYITGSNDTPINSKHLYEMVPEYLELNKLALDILHDDGLKQPFMLAYCLCDCMGNEVPIGTSHGYQFQ